MASKKGTFKVGAKYGAILGGLVMGAAGLKKKNKEIGLRTLGNEAAHKDEKRYARSVVKERFVLDNGAHIL